MGRNDPVQAQNVLKFGIVLFILLFIPIGGILFKIDWIMSTLGCDARSLQQATVYTRTIMIGFFFEALYDLEKKYLLCFGKANIPLAIQTFTLLIDVALSLILIKLGYGLFGIALSVTHTFFLNFVIL